MQPLWPDRRYALNSIRGTKLDLVPLQPALHGPLLHSLFSDAATWQYLRDGPFPTVDLYIEHLQGFLDRTAFASYIVTDQAAGDILGKMSLLHPEPASHSLEIGYVVLAPSVRGSAFGKQAVAHLIEAAFTTFGCDILKWRCDARNIASAKFAAKFGFEQTETILKQMVVKGVDRDTLCFELPKARWTKAAPVPTGGQA